MKKVIRFVISAAALASLKEGKPAGKGTTQAYGCGIKYSRTDA